jgi:hypothetical protein
MPKSRRSRAKSPARRSRAKSPARRSRAKSRVKPPARRSRKFRTYRKGGVTLPGATVNGGWFPPSGPASVQLAPGPQFPNDSEPVTPLETLTQPDDVEQLPNPLLMDNDQIWAEMLRLIDSIDGDKSYIETLLRIGNEDVKTQLRSLIAIGKSHSQDKTSEIKTLYERMKDTAQKAACTTALVVIVLLYAGYKRAIGQNVKSTEALQAMAAELKAERHDRNERSEAFRTYLNEFRESRMAQDKNFFELIESKIF